MQKNCKDHVYIDKHAYTKSNSPGRLLENVDSIYKSVHKSGNCEYQEEQLGPQGWWSCSNIQQSQNQERDNVFNVIEVSSETKAVNNILYKKLIFVKYLRTLSTSSSTFTLPPDLKAASSGLEKACWKLLRINKLIWFQKNYNVPFLSFSGNLSEMTWSAFSLPIKRRRS